MRFMLSAYLFIFFLQESEPTDGLLLILGAVSVFAKISKGLFVFELPQLKM